MGISHGFQVYTYVTLMALGLTWHLDTLLYPTTFMSLHCPTSQRCIIITEDISLSLPLKKDFNGMSYVNLIVLLYMYMYSFLQ